MPLPAAGTQAHGVRRLACRKSGNACFCEQKHGTRPSPTADTQAHGVRRLACRKSGNACFCEQKHGTRQRMLLRAEAWHRVFTVSCLAR